MSEIKKDSLIQEYLDTNKEQMVSVEQLVVFLMEDKGMSYNDAKVLGRENKGLIITYAKRHLVERIGNGARNSQALMQLLNQLVNDEKEIIESDNKVIVNISDKDNGVL